MADGEQERREKGVTTQWHILTCIRTVFGRRSKHHLVFMVTTTNTDSEYDTSHPNDSMNVSLISALCVALCWHSMLRSLARHLAGP